MIDKSKHDEEVKDALFTLQLSHRVSKGLCIYCGLVSAPLGACAECKEQKRAERIAKYGADYYMSEGEI